jgi:hypothetical protein
MGHNFHFWKQAAPARAIRALSSSSAKGGRLGGWIRAAHASERWTLRTNSKCWREHLPLIPNTIEVSAGNTSLRMLATHREQQPRKKQERTRQLWFCRNRERDPSQMRGSPMAMAGESTAFARARGFGI